MRNKTSANIICLMLTLPLLTGCAGFGNRLNRMEVSMNKQEVRQLLGSTYVARASKVDAAGNVLDLWEYKDQKNKQSYQIYFLNDKVSQWGHREDLAAFPELYSPKHR